MMNGNCQIGIDIGGTFTDVVILDPDSGRLTVGKKLTSSERPAQAVIQVIGEMLMVAEGVKSAPTVIALGERYGIETPIMRDVYSVLQGEGTPRQAFRGLLRTTVGAESEPG